MYLRKSAIPSANLARAARALALQIGLAGAARSVGVSLTAYAMIVGRLPGHKSTHRLVEETLSNSCK